MTSKKKSNAEYFANIFPSLSDEVKKNLKWYFIPIVQQIRYLLWRWPHRENNSQDLDLLVYILFPNLKKWVSVKKFASNKGMAHGYVKKLESSYYEARKFLL